MLYCRVLRVSVDWKGLFKRAMYVYGMWCNAEESSSSCGMQPFLSAVLKGSDPWRVLQPLCACTSLAGDERKEKCSFPLKTRQGQEGTAAL